MVISTASTTPASSIAADIGEDAGLDVVLEIGDGDGRREQGIEAGPLTLGGGGDGPPPLTKLLARAGSRRADRRCSDVVEAGPAHGGVAAQVGRHYLGRRPIPTLMGGMRPPPAPQPSPRGRGRSAPPPPGWFRGGQFCQVHKRAGKGRPARPRSPDSSGDEHELRGGDAMPAQAELYRVVERKLQEVLAGEGVRITTVRRLALLIIGLVAAKSSVVSQMATGLWETGVSMARGG